VECRDNTGSDEVNPDSYAGFDIRIGREKMRGRGCVGIFEELADYRAFVKGFVIILEGWHEASRVQFKERVRFMVRVYLGMIRMSLYTEGENDLPRYIGMGFSSPIEQGELVDRMDRTIPSRS